MSLSTWKHLKIWLMFTRGYSTAVHPPRGRCRQSCGDVGRQERTASDLCPLYLLWQSINSTLRCVRERHEPAHSPLYFSVCCSQFHTIICHHAKFQLFADDEPVVSFLPFVCLWSPWHTHTHTKDTCMLTMTTYLRLGRDVHFILAYLWGPWLHSVYWHM